MTGFSSDVFAIEHACDRLISELARCIDRRDLDGLRNVFTADGEFDRGNAVAHGIDEIIAFIAAIPSHMTMRHMYTNIVIDVQGDGVAIGHANYVAYSRSDKAEDPRATLTPISVGSVIDHYRRTASGWRIAKRTIERLS